ncbi:MAG TPA: carboxypeptidase-like regulatory domain-containing protein, partial [Pyrinomonadaceae bacterium]|nr:carboxypeptidase-like regulatory domain-containing protein [Pyrinomonadaceae bacterium]
MSSTRNVAANLVAGSVTGKVTDLTGNALAGIEVHASPLEGAGEDAHDTTKAGGNYQLTNLNAGKYELHVASPGT